MTVPATHVLQCGLEPAIGLLMTAVSSGHQLELSIASPSAPSLWIDQALPDPGPRSEGLKVAALFAGIGGIELGLDRRGHHSLMMCEIDSGARAVLEKRFPGIHLPSDIVGVRDFPDGTELVTAGFPCQDLSQAGQTRGIGGSRSGLIGEVFRLLRRRRAPWVLLENVSFMLQLGRGRALEVIIDELEQLGYDWAYRVVDSRAFGLPQRRRRVYILASLDGDPRDVLLADDAEAPLEPTATRSRSFGFYWTEGVRGLGAAVDAVPTLKGGSTLGIPSPPAVVLPGSAGRIITPDIRDAERLQGFPSNWTEPATEATRRKGFRWRLVGNAVTVDVAEWIGLRLRAPGVYEAEEDHPLPKGERWPTAAWGRQSNGVRVRCSSRVSEWPMRIEGDPLHRFLDFKDNDLSARATAGFLKRLRSSRLNRPKWFERILERHLARMSDRA